MTQARRQVYRKSWYKRECKEGFRLLRKNGNQYNKKIRHCKLADFAYDKRHVYCATIS